MELKLTLSLLVVLFQLSRPWHIQFEIRPDVVFDYTLLEKEKKKNKAAAQWRQPPLVSRRYCRCKSPPASEKTRKPEVTFGLCDSK